MLFKQLFSWRFCYFLYLSWLLRPPCLWSASFSSILDWITVLSARFGCFHPGMMREFAAPLSGLWPPESCAWWFCPAMKMFIYLDARRQSTCIGLLGLLRSIKIVWQSHQVSRTGLSVEIKHNRSASETGGFTSGRDTHTDWTVDTVDTEEGGLHLWASPKTFSAWERTASMLRNSKDSRGVACP